MPEQAASPQPAGTPRSSRTRRNVSLVLLVVITAAVAVRVGMWLKDRVPVAGAGESTRPADDSEETLQPARYLEGHTDGVHAVDISRDGTLVATAGHDQTARLWDFKTGRQLQNFVGHDGPVYAASISRDGARVATAGADGAVMVWDAKSGELIAILEGHSPWALRVRFLPDGTLLSAGTEGTVRRWDVDKEREIAVMPHGDAVTALALSADGKRALSGAQDGTIILWDLDRNRPVWGATPPPSPGKPLNINDAAFSPDGSKVYTAQFYGFIHEYDAETGKHLRRLEEFTFGVAIDVAAGGGRAAIATARGSTWWTLDPLKIQYVLDPQDESTHSIAVSPDGRNVIAAKGGKQLKGGGWQSTGDGRVPIWDVGGKH